MTKEQILANRGHRPFPMPDKPWVMQQTWKDLLFLHYKIPASVMRQYVPETLELDMFDGEAWLGITPFKMRNVRFRWAPPVPTAANFLELNVRTYVKFAGKSGIYFFSLDSSSSLSVLGARLGALLPYYAAQMSVKEEDGSFHYRSLRKGGFEKPVGLDIRYKPASGIFESKPGSLEEWLTGRYCLFQPTGERKVLEIDIHHVKWPLQTAETEVLSNNMTEPVGLALPRQRPLAHFSKGVKVLVWPPRRLAAAPVG